MVPFVCGASMLGDEVLLNRLGSSEFGFKIRFQIELRSLFCGGCRDERNKAELVVGSLRSNLDSRFVWE